jgi:cytochrome b involved in lipid metabolism
MCSTKTMLTNENSSLVIKMAVTELNPLSSFTLPDLVSIQSHCDACPYCPDICLDTQCNRCSKKSRQLKEKRLSINETMEESSGVPVAFRMFPRNQKIAQNETYITQCELERHNTMESAWLLCGNVVYDATNYINGHPGGERSILRKCGGAADCSKDMKFHSERAISMWKKNRVGVLRPCPGKDGLTDDFHDESNESCVIS